MNLAPLLGSLTYLLLRGKGKKAVTWKEVQAWIATHCDAETRGAGFFGGRLDEFTSDSFVDLRREGLPGGRVRVTAAYVIDPRRPVVATRTQWEADELDSELAHLFGRGMRVRIKV